MLDTILDLLKAELATLEAYIVRNGATDDLTTRRDALRDAIRSR